MWRLHLVTTLIAWTHITGAHITGAHVIRPSVIGTPVVRAPIVWPPVILPAIIWPTIIRARPLPVIAHHPVTVAVHSRILHPWVRSTTAIHVWCAWRRGTITTHEAGRWTIAAPNRRRWRRTAPAIPFAVKIAAAIIAIPIIIDLEGHRRNAERLIIIRIDIDPAVGILRLQIAAGNPAAITRVTDIAPIGRRQAAEDPHGITGWHDQNRGILCAGPGPQVNIRSRKCLGRLSGHRQGNCHQPCKGRQVKWFHRSDLLGRP